MPTKYCDRLKLPIQGSDSIQFATHNGLNVAKGYERVLLGGKMPLVEFGEGRMNMENIYIPGPQKWRVSQPASEYVEYRSKDYCNVKIMLWKQDDADFKKGMFYISPFSLRSDEVPVLIIPLRRRHTLQSA